MLIRCMIDFQIHHDLNASFMGCGQHMVKVLHGSEFLHNCLIITDIISIIIIRRLIHGREPYDVDSKLP